MAGEAWESEARDERGRWTSGGGGGGVWSGEPGSVFQKAMLAGEKRTDAFGEAMAAGEKVNVPAEEAKAVIEAAAAKSPPPINLECMHVDGIGNGNLFDHSATETPRSEMPQIPGDPAATARWGETLQEHGISATLEEVAPTDLNATQNEMDTQKVDNIAKWAEGDNGERLRSQFLMVSKDGDVLDGHHRWGAAAIFAMNNPGFKVPVVRANADINTLLQIGREFAAREGIASEAMGDFKRG